MQQFLSVTRLDLLILIYYLSILGLTNDSDPVFCAVYKVFTHLMTIFESIGDVWMTYADNVYTDIHAKHYGKLTGLRVDIHFLSSFYNLDKYILIHPVLDQAIWTNG